MVPAEIVGGVVRVGAAAAGRAVGTGGELADGPVRIGVRPEFVQMSAQPVTPGLPGRITGVDRMGAYHLVRAEVDGHPFVAKVDRATAAARDVEHFRFAADRAFLFRDAVRCGALAPLGEEAQP